MPEFELKIIAFVCNGFADVEDLFMMDNLVPIKGGEIFDEQVGAFI
jgi:hypothetical protein